MVGVSPELKLPKKINEILLPDEKILNSFPNRKWGGKDYIIPTDKRLILYYGGVFSYSYDALEYSKISSLNYEGHMFLSSMVKITEGTVVFEINTYSKDEARVIVNYLKEIIDQAQTTSVQSLIHGELEIYGELDLETKLTKLKDLMDRGLITEEEYNSKKQELLSRY